MAAATAAGDGFVPVNDAWTGVNLHHEYCEIWNEPNIGFRQLPIRQTDKDEGVLATEHG